MAPSRAPGGVRWPRRAATALLVAVAALAMGADANPALQDAWFRVEKVTSVHDGGSRHGAQVSAELAAITAVFDEVR